MSETSPLEVLANLYGVKEEIRIIARNILEILQKKHQFIPTIIKKDKNGSICILWPTLSCFCLIKRSMIHLFVEHRLDSRQSCRFNYAMNNLFNFIKQMQTIMLLG